LTSPTGHEKSGNVNPGKPDLLAGNVLQQHYNFSLLVFCLHLTIIDCRASGLSQIQLSQIGSHKFKNSKNSTTVLKIPKSVVVQHKIGAQ